MKPFTRLAVQAGLVCACACAYAEAAYVDGNKLLEYMRASGQDSIFAMGYVTATLDTADGIMFCVPVGARTSQAYDAVKLYIESNPSVRHYNASVLINGALTRIWPCKK